jgi:YesN/AraC family two-component response regulator
MKDLISNATQKQDLEQIITHIKEENFNPKHIKCRVGVGNKVDTLFAVNVSYKNANVAINYQFSELSIDEIAYYEGIEESARKKGFIPEYKEGEIILKAYKGDYDGICDIITNLLKIVSENNSRSQINIQCLYYNLLSTAFKIIRESKIDIGESINEYELVKASSIYDIKRNLIKLYKLICQEMVSLKQETKNVKRDDIIGDIINYIIDNYNDENLTLKELALKFNLSVPYLSRFFKIRTGYNFIDFLGIKRIEKAKILLIDTDTNIEQIGKMIGYYNSLTFRRAFRKYEGVNPSEYRDMKKSIKTE